MRKEKNVIEIIGDIKQIYFWKKWWFLEISFKLNFKNQIQGSLQKLAFVL